MAKIKIRNLKRQMRVFNLEHNKFVSSPDNSPAGQPESITFLPLETKEVDEEVALCREVKAALTRHPRRRPTLRVVS